MVEETKTETQITAEHLAKEFKEHSVAEFFKKNMQMLGLTGKIKTLTTIVHEYVTNSVTSETPTVVRENGEIRFEEIGKVIDNKMSLHGFNENKEKELQSLREFPKFEVLCFDKETQKLVFKEVKSLHRHKMENGERIFKIKTLGNRFVEATKHHGLFTLRKGVIEEVKAENLRIGDYLVVPRKPWIQETINEINLLEEFLKLDDKELKEFSVFGVKKILYSDKELKNKIKSLLTKKEQHYGVYNKYMKCDRLPLRLLKILNEKEKKIFYNCEIGERHSKYKLKPLMPITKELMQILGLFVAEGSTRKNNVEVNFSFEAHEKELIEYTADLFEKVFNIRPLIKKAHATAVNVKINSKTISIMLKKVLKCGENAKTKSIPTLVFSSGKEKAKEFLIAYAVGDGFPSGKIFECIKKSNFSLKEKITLVTASKKLSTQLQYLLSGLGYSYSFSQKKAEQRLVKDKLARFGQNYKIEFYTEQKNSPLNFYPMEIGDMTTIIEPKLKWAISQRNQKIVSYEKIASLKINEAQITESAARFIAGDLGILPITEIEERIPKENEYVYDYSIEKDENFVGGFGAICLHNSVDACEESHILPDIEVKIAQIAEDHLEITVTDNGPGLTKQTVGKALGQLLAGTKFHRLIQQRGQQGIGAAGCTMLSQMTTGKTVQVISGTAKEVFACEVAVDAKTNQPKIINLRDLDKKFKGLAIKAQFKGVKYINNDQSPLEYLRRTVIANPHVQVKFSDPLGETTIFHRTSKTIPLKPIAIQPHPKGVTVDELSTLAKHTDGRKISSFLKNSFDRMGDKAIEEISKGVSFDLNKDPKKLTWEEAEEIIKQFKKIEFIAPRLDALRPIGEERIEKSMKAIVQPEFISVITRKPTVYQGGFPFQVEIGIAFGGNAGKVFQGTSEETGEQKKIELMRFANKVPLLFDAGGCATTKAVESVDWKRYGVKDLDNVPLTVLVNVISVHIPYTSAGKQAISEEQEVIEEIRLGIMDAGRRIWKHISESRREQEKQEKKKLFMKYAQEIAIGLSELTKEKRESIEKKLVDIVSKKLKLEEKLKKEGKLEEKEEVIKEEKVKEEGEFE